MRDLESTNVEAAAHWAAADATPADRDLPDVITCENCQGDGHVFGATCRDCDGAGWVV